MAVRPAQVASALRSTLQAHRRRTGLLNRRILYTVATRPSTASVVYHFDFERQPIITKEHADDVARCLTEPEQDLLIKSLEEALKKRRIGSRPHGDDITRGQTRALFLVNALPFVGFGFLDNMIMIVAGEYIDQSLGAVLCLSTMAAAAIGNLVSDVAGVGLAHYVEVLVSKAGIKQPVLTAAQLDSSKARWASNGARAAGLSLGCIIGMFPLLFYNNDDEKEEKNKKKVEE